VGVCVAGGVGGGNVRAYVHGHVIMSSKLCAFLEFGLLFGVHSFSTREGKTRSAHGLVSHGGKV
jgi:hypothetical protein